jgi:hypothetical protein
MKILLCVFCVTNFAIAAARGADASPAVAAPAHKSAFDAATERNPFWPIGWKKPNAGGSGPALTAASFNLTSITTGTGPRFAILNGKILAQGQQFGLQVGHDIYQVTVQSIQDGEVVLNYPGGNVVVPLHRH